MIVGHTKELFRHYALCSTYGMYNNEGFFETHLSGVFLAGHTCRTEAQICKNYVKSKYISMIIDI